ncbi:uncharacterized protein LOC115994044 [Quercus lobata]|uniref:uncharacterized protein LOC115994044 n=1 Tax=Quercus lobata TaxID=97700 RepID=UPI0012447F67|nr:uncharacterized protein LOC115994044 [Quercus lobata]
MAVAYFMYRPLRSLVCIGIGTFLYCRFPHGPFPYIDSLIERFTADESSMAEKELLARKREAKIKMDRIYHIIRKKGGAANSMTLGELAEDLKDFGGMWSNLAESKGNNMAES